MLRFFALVCLLVVSAQSLAGSKGFFFDTSSIVSIDQELNGEFAGKESVDNPDLAHPFASTIVYSQSKTRRSSALTAHLRFSQGSSPDIRGPPGPS